MEQNDHGESSPWICHVCDRKATSGAGTACSVCYKTTCATHLRQTTTFNRESGLYELTPVCVCCVVLGVS